VNLGGSSCRGSVRHRLPVAGIAAVLLAAKKRGFINGVLAIVAYGETGRSGLAREWFGVH